MAGERAASPCFGTALRKASRRVKQLYDEALQQAGLTSTQFAILAALNTAGDDAPTLANLARSLVIERSALGHTLRPLERDGLVAVLEGRADRRQRHVVLTARGKATYREARQLWQVAQGRIFAVLGEEQAASLRAALLGVAYNERLGRLSD